MCYGLLSGKYSAKQEEDGEVLEQSGISPVMFRSLIGKGHQEFSTKKQQDACEFLLYLINTMDVRIPQNFNNLCHATLHIIIISLYS